MPAKKEAGPTSGDDEPGPDAQSLIGSQLEVPGSVFGSPGTFKGRVTGTPKTRNRKHTRCYVRFEKDTTEYWFPSKDVASWVVGNGEGRARPAAGQAPEAASTDEQGLTSEYDTNAEPTDGETEAEDEKPPLGSRASAQVVARGAEYGVPLGITLLVLVLAGLVWFCAQLWHSERQLVRDAS